MDKKIMKLIEGNKKVEGFLCFVIEKDNVQFLTYNLCGHDLIYVAKDLTTKAKEWLKEEKNAKGSTKKRNK
jgi:hypothetical protein